MSQPIGAAIYGSPPAEPATAEQPVLAAGDEVEPAAYRAKVTHAAEKFEGFFIEQILQQMRRSVRDIDPDEAESTKRGEDDMVDMADGMLADTLSHQHAFGVADAILRQLLPTKARRPLKVPPPPVALTQVKADPTPPTESRL